MTVTLDGYIKRTPLSTFRAQKRGGKGRAGMATKDEDAVTNLFVTSTHNPVLFFSTAGKVYRLKVWRLPEGGPTARGPADGQPAAAGRGRDDLDRAAAARGRGGMGRAPRHVRHRQGHASGATAWTPSPTSRPPARSRCASTRARTATNDRLIGVALLTEDDDVLLATRNGKAIRFAADRRPRVPEPHFDRRARHAPAAATTR